MNTILIIQLDIFMVILLAGIILHAYFKLDKKDPANRVFSTLLCLTIAILILEILSVVLDQSALTGALRTVDVVGFFLTPVIPLVAMLYAYKRINKYKKLPLNKCKWLLVPFVIHGILALGSYEFNWIFSINAANTYVRGPLFFVSPLTSYFYYLVYLFLVFDSRAKLQEEDVVTLSCLTLIPALLSFFQLYYFIYLTIWNGVAIAVIINYISIMYNQVKRDPLTGLGNRLAYDEYLSQVKRKGNIVLAVINMDLDNFKGINDAFGHREGDEALRFFARELETVFAGTGIAIRTGGDEFVVLLRERRKSILEQYIKSLQERIDEYNVSGKVPYRLQFSYGIAVFDESYADVHAFIQHSDRLMYQDKQRKSQARGGLSAD